MNSKYYRTYVFTIKLSNGIHYYAGKRVSKFENPEHDNYTGSGKVIRSAFKKHGYDMYINREWQDHETEELMEEFEELLVDECKEKYGKRCINIAKGGRGGNPMKYASEEDKLKYRAVLSATLKCVKRSDEARAANRATQNRPEVRAANTAANRITKRKSDVWQIPLYETLWTTWMSTIDKNGNRLKYVRFATHLRNTCIIPDCASGKVLGIVDHFNRVVAGEEPLHHPITF